MSKYITTNYQCKKCGKQYEFSESKDIHGIRQYQCRHFILKFIKNFDNNNMIKYIVSIKCRKCSKKSEKQLQISNNKNINDFNSNEAQCCGNQISFASFFSSQRLESTTSINNNAQSNMNNVNNNNFNFNQNNNMNNFNNNNIQINRSNSSNMNMNIANNQNMMMNNFNMNQNQNNNFHKGFSGDVINNNLMNSFNMDMQSNMNNFQNNNMNLNNNNINNFNQGMNNMNNMSNMNNNMNNMNNNMNNQNSNFVNMNMQQQNIQFNNNSMNMNMFQNDFGNNMNNMNNGMNNDTLFPQTSDINNMQVTGENNWNYNYLEGEHSVWGQVVSFIFDYKQVHYPFKAKNNRLFKEVVYEFLNMNPIIKNSLSTNQKFLVNGEVVDLNTNNTLYDLKIKNNTIVLIHWTGN